MSDDVTPDEVPVFTVVESGRTIDSDGRALPTVVIDARDVPQVADLARVHAVEGVGDIRTEAVRSGDTIVLGVRMTTPVLAMFAIAIDVREHLPLLNDVLEHEALVIAHTDPRTAAADQPNWLSVDIDGTALAARLASG